MWDTAQAYYIPSLISLYKAGNAKASDRVKPTGKGRLHAQHDTEITFEFGKIAIRMLTDL